MGFFKYQNDNLNDLKNPPAKKMPLVTDAIPEPGTAPKVIVNGWLEVANDWPRSRRKRNARTRPFTMDQIRISCAISCQTCPSSPSSPIIWLWSAGTRWRRTRARSITSARSSPAPLFAMCTATWTIRLALLNAGRFVSCLNLTDSKFEKQGKICVNDVRTRTQ